MTYQSEVLADSPVAYWTLDTFAASKFVSSVGTHDLTVINASAPTVIASKLGNCISFNGTSNTGLTGGAGSGNIIPSSTTFSVECLWKAASVPSAKTIMACDNEGAFTERCWALRLDAAGKLDILVFSGGNVKTGTGTSNVCNGAWHHIVMTYDGAFVRVYVDAALEWNGAFTGAVNSSTSSTFRIGQYETGGVVVVGQVDEAALYSTCLAPARISAHFSAATEVRVAQEVARVLVTSPGDVRVAQEAARVLIETKPSSVLAGQQVEVVTKTDPAVRLAGQQLEAVVTATPDVRLAGQQLEVVVLPPAYQAAVLADGPVMYLPMQETSGTSAIDYSGALRHGTYTGGAVINDLADPPPANGTGLHVYLDGTNDYIQLATGSWFNPTTAGFTFEGWYYVRAWSNWARIFDFANTSNVIDMALMHNLTNSTMELKVNNVSTQFPRWALFIWTHVVVTVTTAGAAILYVDGVQFGTGTVGAPTSGTRNRMWIGQSQYAVDNLSSSVSNISLYDKVLTPTRVLAHYNAAGPTTNIVGTRAQVSRESARVATQAVGAAQVSRLSARAAMPLYPHRLAGQNIDVAIQPTPANLLAGQNIDVAIQPVPANVLAGQNIDVAIAAGEYTGPAPPTGPVWSIWNGTTEVPATITIWNGTAEVPATSEIEP